MSETKTAPIDIGAQEQAVEIFARGGGHWIRLRNGREIGPYVGNEERDQVAARFGYNMPLRTLTAGGRLLLSGDGPLDASTTSAT